MDLPELGTIRREIIDEQIEPALRNDVLPDEPFEAVAVGTGAGAHGL